MNIDQIVNQAYSNLTNLVKSNAFAPGDYFGMIIPKDELNNLINYVDEIINNLFFKFCNELKDKVIINDLKLISYKSYCFNKPSSELLNDCLMIVNNNLSVKKSSNNTTLIDSLNLLKLKYNEEELQKSLNTIFDILLNYYSSFK